MIESRSGEPYGLRLHRAGSEDVAELCVLQRCCWVSEAISNDTLDVPALRESLADVAEWVRDRHVWLLRQGARLVAAVRAHRDGPTWEIGRLMVAPDLSGRGVGRWLLAYAEAQAPRDVRRIILFTGASSTRNLTMYRRAGYRETAPDVQHRGQHIRGAVSLSKPVVGAVVTDVSRSRWSRG